MIDLARHGTVTGIELSATSVALARARNSGEVIEGSVLEMPFAADSFELAASLDVIEHLEDDLAALRELRRVVAPGGALLVTVPAYQWLWSGHDEINHHHRRYTRSSLLAVAREAGWEPVRTTYFNSLLLPVAIALRILDRFARKTTESSLDLWVPPPALNWLLERPLALEAALIGRGGRIPAGLSARVSLRTRQLPLTGDTHRAAARQSPMYPRCREHLERPRPVDEERRHRHHRGRAHLCEQLIHVRVMH